MNNPFDETLKHNILIGIKNAKNCIETGRGDYALAFLEGLKKIVELTDTVEPSNVHPVFAGILNNIYPKGEPHNFANADEENMRFFSQGERFDADPDKQYHVEDEKEEIPEMRNEFEPHN